MTAQEITRPGQFGRTIADLMGTNGFSSERERNEQARKMSFVLDELFERYLTPEERAAYDRHEWTTSMRDRFDETIIGQAGVYGPTILISSSVQLRCLQWSRLDDAEKGIRLLRDLFDAILHRVKIARGKAKGAMKDPRIRAYKDRVVPEMRMLLRSYRDRADTQLSKKVSEWLCEKVEEQPDTYDELYRNLVSFKGYLQQLPERDPARSRRLIVGKITPEDFFIGWYGWSENLADNTIRIRIAQLGKTKS